MIQQSLIIKFIIILSFVISGLGIYRILGYRCGAKMYGCHCSLVSRLLTSNAVLANGIVQSFGFMTQILIVLPHCKAITCLVSLSLHSREVKMWFIHEDQASKIGDLPMFGKGICVRWSSIRSSSSLMNKDPVCDLARLRSRPLHILKALSISSPNLAWSVSSRQTQGVTYVRPDGISMRLSTNMSTSRGKQFSVDMSNTVTASSATRLASSAKLCVVTSTRLCWR